MSSPAGYSRIQITLHWTIAALVVLQYVFSDQMEEAWDAVEKGTAQGGGLHPHAISGVIILILVAWRLVLRLRRGTPAAPEHGALVALAGKLTHWLIYGLIIVIPLSGLGAWAGGIGQAADAHEVLTKVLMFAIILHVTAALIHQFVWKDGLIRRMMKSG